MEKIQIYDRNPIISSGIALLCFVYIFFYQLAYPFNPALFLYAIFGLCILLIVFSGTIKLNYQILFMFTIILVSGIGALYTRNSAEGIREAVILAVMFIFIIANQNNNALNVKLDRVIDFGSTIVLLSIFIQFILQESFNDFMQSILRKDCFEQLTWSFGVDRAFAGFSAYTVDAAFFSAIIFGKYSMRLFGFSDTNKKEIIFNAIMTGFSLFAVFLTSKRGVLVGMIVALFLTMMLLRRISKHTSWKILIAAVVIILALIVLYSTNEAAKNFLNRFLVGEDTDITTGRTIMYMVAMNKLFNGNFVFGFGTGAIYDLFSSGLHNIYLQIMYDHGIMGLIPYMLFFIYNLILAYKVNNSRSMYIQILMLVYGLFGNPIYSNMILITYLIQTAGLNNCPNSDRNMINKESVNNERRSKI